MEPLYSKPRATLLSRCVARWLDRLHRAPGEDATSERGHDEKQHRGGGKSVRDVPKRREQDTTQWISDTNIWSFSIAEIGRSGDLDYFQLDMSAETHE